jgi:hypothetical protein
MAMGEPETARRQSIAKPREAIHVVMGTDGMLRVGRGGRISLDPSDIGFVHAVVVDLDRIAATPEGEEVLRRGDAIGHHVRIVKPDPPTEPPNGWILPDDLAAATAQGVAAAGGGHTGTGAGCGSTIVYDPADWPRRGDPRSPTSVGMLLLLLRQANLNAAGKSNPALPDWGDMA